MKYLIKITYINTEKRLDKDFLNKEGNLVCGDIIFFNIKIKNKTSRVSLQAGITYLSNDYDNPSHLFEYNFGDIEDNVMFIIHNDFSNITEDEYLKKDISFFLELDEYHAIYNSLLELKSSINSSKEYIKRRENYRK